MSDKPILFSGPMVRALLDGTKTQTRRVLKPQPEFRGGCGDYHDAEEWGWEDECGTPVSVLDICPNGMRKGDRLWVRENWQGLSFGDYMPTKSRICDLRYAATDALADAPRDVRGYPWRPSIHMPRWASRLTLTVTDVRVQRLREISEADARAEGVSPITEPNDLKWEHYAPHGVAFAALWDSINGPGAWDANPWVAAYTFTVQRGNIDKQEPPHA